MVWRASGMVNTLKYQEGGAPREGMEASPSPTLPLPCSMYLFHVALPDFRPL